MDDVTNLPVMAAIHDPRPAPTLNPIVVPLDFVIRGESHYTDNIKTVLGDLPEGELDAYAQLVPDPENPYDPNAVKVMVSGYHVGFIGREDARRLSPHLQQLIAAGLAPFVTVRVWGSQSWSGDGRYVGSVKVVHK